MYHVFEVELNHAGYPKQVFFNTTNAETCIDFTYII